MSKSENPELIERLADYERRIVPLETFRQIHEEALVEFPVLAAQAINAFGKLWGPECAQALGTFLKGIHGDMAKMLAMTAATGTTDG